MASIYTELNPFSMMMDPEAILREVERSDRLSRLQRRVCRPLDRPLIPKIQSAEQLAFDKAVDAEPEEDFSAELQAEDLNHQE